MRTWGVALAVSGGADSRLLLRTLVGHVLSPKHRVVVLSVDHALRPESRTEAEIFAARAKVLGFHAKSLNLYPSRFDNVRAGFHASLRTLKP